MDRLQRFTEKLSEIAKSGGNHLALDSAQEVQRAIKMVDEELKLLEQEGAGTCTTVFVEGAREQLLAWKPGDNPLFVRRDFEEPPSGIINTVMCWAFGPSDDSSPLVSLPEGMVASFRVFAGGSQWDLSGKPVFVSEQEWARITQPLVEAQQAREGIVHFSWALERAVGIFEEVVGPKAGTKGDIGGADGNRELQRGLPKPGQQDCVGETLTTQQLLSALQVAGLLGPFRFDPADGVAKVGELSDGVFLHEAVRLKGPNGENYVVDSWFGDNGESARVMTHEAWEPFAKRNALR